MAVTWSFGGSFTDCYLKIAATGIIVAKLGSGSVVGSPAGRSWESRLRDGFGKVGVEPNRLEEYSRQCKSQELWATRLQPWRKLLRSGCCRWVCL